MDLNRREKKNLAVAAAIAIFALACSVLFVRQCTGVSLPEPVDRTVLAVFVVGTVSGLIYIVFTLVARGVAFLKGK